MNLNHLNLDLDLHGISGDTDTQIAVFLIAADLKTRKLINAFSLIGCDACFCISDLFALIFALVAFEHRPDSLTDFYFELLDQYCDRVSHENAMPAKEAYIIYQQLKTKQQEMLKAKV